MGFSDLGKKLSKIGQDTKNGVQKVSDSVSISNRITAEKKSLERLSTRNLRMSRRKAWKMNGLP